MKRIFSIIIPAYNLGSLISCAIDSCIRQQGISHDDYEIIVINDGSTDDTKCYIEKYKDVDNIIVINQKNQGLSRTRNNGINEACGEYIIFLDGDDWLADNALATLKEYVDSYDLIVFPMLYYYNEYNIVKKSYNLKEKLYGRDEFLHATLGNLQFHIIPAQNKCYKRSVLKSSDIQFIPNILHEDNPFFINAIFNYSLIRYIDIPLYYYRQNREGSITNTYSIKNYNGVMIGTKEIINTVGLINKDVNLLLANLYVFQVLGNYSSKEDMHVVFDDFRTLRIKKQLIKLLLNSTFRWKHCLRMILLIIDPYLLKFIIKLL